MSLLNSYPLLFMWRIFAQGQTKDGVYEWSSSPVKSSSLLAFSSVKATSSEWHHRLGYPAFPILRHLVSKFGLDLSSPITITSNCNACHCNKSHKLPFHSSSITSTQPLQIIFFDMWTSVVFTYDDFKYYVIFVDHYTKYIWYYPFKCKSHVYDVFVKFKALVEIFLIRKKSLYTLTMVGNIRH